MTEILHPLITTIEHDGPLRTIRAVEFADGHKLVQVDTCLATVGEPFTMGRDTNARDVMVRFDREELAQMLGLVDEPDAVAAADERMVAVLDGMFELGREVTRLRTALTEALDIVESRICDDGQCKCARVDELRALADSHREPGTTPSSDKSAELGDAEHGTPRAPENQE